MKLDLTLYDRGSATEIAMVFNAPEISAAEIVEATLARIEVHNGALNAFTDIVGQRARARAKEVDNTILRHVTDGSLAGMPFAVKNVFDLAGLSTRAGSKVNRDREVTSRDATLVERIEAAGAICVGALNMGEYAYDFTGEAVHDGASRNPHDLTRMSSGSSGGTGSAIGGELVPIALAAGMVAAKRPASMD